MDRRAFIGSLALGILTGPDTTRAELVRKVHRIGIGSPGATADMVGPQPRGPATNALLRGMHELGYRYGEHFMTEPRGADGRPERHRGVAAELVRLQVDVIVAGGIMAPAFKHATSTIPIVMAGASDPVGDKLVASLGRPDGNFTGLSLQSTELTGKRLELLKELVPGASLVAVFWDRSTQSGQVAEAAARERGWKLLSIEIREEGDIERAFTTATAARASAILVGAPGILVTRARRVAELAARSRLPAMYVARSYVEDGGLMSYGADIVEIYRRAASFVDRILKGAKPGDLPVEQPTKFELVINVKAAKTIGLTIPPSLLARADEILR